MAQTLKVPKMYEIESGGFEVIETLDLRDLNTESLRDFVFEASKPENSVSCVRTPKGARLLVIHRGDTTVQELAQALDNREDK